MNGSDSWDGKAEKYTSGTNGPWKTLTNVDKKTTYKSGDIIQFKAGGEWDLRDCEDKFFEFRSSGAIGNPIILTSYGNGSKPVFNGHYPDGSLFGDTVEINGHYVTLKGLEIKKTWSFGLVTQSIRSEHHGVTIRDCYIHDTGRDGIYGPFGEFNLTIINNTIENTGLRVGGGGIVIEGDGNYHGSNIEIAYNKVIQPQGDGITLHEGSSIEKNHLGTNISIHHNEVFGSLNGDGIDLTTGSNVRVFNNNVHDCNSQLIHTDCSFRDAVIYNNILWGNASTGLAYLQVSNVTFYNNIVMVAGGKTPYALNINSDNYHELPVKEVFVFRNTFVYDFSMTHSGLVEVADELGTLGAVTINSNIFTTTYKTSAPSLIHFQFSSFPANDKDFSCDGNIYGPGTFNIRDRSTNVNWTNWNSIYGHDKNGKIGNPGITWLANHTYSIAEDSICIDAGSDSYSGNDKDVLGTPLYGLPDVGALEYSPPYIMNEDPMMIGALAEVYSDGRFKFSNPSKNRVNVDFSMFSPEWSSSHGQRTITHQLRIDDSNTYGDTVLSWTETDLSSTRTTSYRIANMLPEERFTIILDGIPQLVENSDPSGILQFNLTKSPGPVRISISRKDIPIIVNSIIPLKVGTGDGVEFIVNASDMGGIWEAKIAYWFPNTTFGGNERLTLIAGDENYGTWRGFLSIPETLAGSLHYMITLTDNDGLTTRSKNATVLLIDDVAPTVVEDLTTGSVKAGNDIDFRFSLYDNIGVSSVNLELKEGEEVFVLEMTRSHEYYTRLFKVEDNGLESVLYRLNFTDQAGNTNLTSYRTIVVLDAVDPLLVRDDSDRSAFTGDPFSFDIEVMDDRGLNRTWVECYVASSLRSFSSENGLVQGDIEIPIDAEGFLDYSVFAEDLSGNMMPAYRRSIPITDNDAPTMTEDLSEPSGTTGDVYRISVRMVDNIGIGSVKAEYWVNEPEKQTLALSPLNGLFLGSIKDLPTTPCTLKFRIIALDYSENIMVSMVRNITVLDNDAPLIVTLPVTYLSKDMVKLSLEVTDNTRVMMVTLVLIEGSTTESFPMEGDGSYSMIMNISGRSNPIKVQFTAEDPFGNKVETVPFNLIIPDTEVNDEKEVPIENKDEGTEEESEDDGPLPFIEPSIGNGLGSLLVIGLLTFVLLMVGLILISFLMGRRSAKKDVEDIEGCSISPQDQEGEPIETQKELLPSEEMSPEDSGDGPPESSGEDQPSTEEPTPDIDDIIRELDELNEELKSCPPY